MQFVRTLRIKRSEHEGRGVFTDAPIDDGQRILTIEGPLKTDADPMTPYEDARAYQIGPGLYISPTDPYGPFVNHSCDPNCGFHISGQVATLVAIRRIQPGEELAFDYSTIARDDPWRMDCGCGAAGCRRVIGEFKDLPPALQKRYIDLGIVSDYVRGAVST
ncbi:MAG TPA: SET domain-containing protein-lysine N-methyltransferase [Candidatus Baltobacteraceae bacterium]|nr:SET domain-containing protein-lysine N-methyltransferase [Candidatus Baltobacteraceae bacterium]